MKRVLVFQRARFHCLILLLLFLVLLGWAISGVPAILAQGDETATPEGNYVQEDDIYVRSGPGLNYRPIGQLTLGDMVRPVSISEDGEWVLIHYSRGFGWIRRDLVSWSLLVDFDELPVLSNDNLTPSPDPGRITATPFFPTETPEGNWANPGDEGGLVRAGPGRTYLVLGVLRSGDRVVPVARTEDGIWIMIRYRFGFGWIRVDLVHWAQELDSLPLVATDDPANLTPSATFSRTPAPRTTATPTVTMTPTVTETLPAATIPTETPSSTDTAIPTTIVPTETATSTPSATDTATTTETALPTDTPSPLPTDTAPPTETPTSTDTSTSTPAPTQTDTATATETDAPTRTPVPTDTPAPTSTNTSTATLTATSTETDIPTSTRTPVPTETTAPTGTDTPTDVLESLITPEVEEDGTAIAAAVGGTPELDGTAEVLAAGPTFTPMPPPPVIDASPTAGDPPAETPPTLSPTEPETPTPANTAEPTAVAAVNEPPAETPGAAPQSEAPVQPSPLPPEVPIVGGLLGGALLYGLFYVAGAASAARYRSGFVAETCPICGQGKLFLDERRRRFLGIPRVRRTVRCDYCGSVLREVGRSRWRYTVDGKANVRLYQQLNGREVTDADLASMSASIPPRSVSPGGRSPGGTFEAPQYIEDESPEE